MIEQDEPTIHHQSSERVGQLLDEWLSRPEWELEEAYDWLQGYYLPPVGHDDYPFVWMHRGLLLIEERYEAETELARRMARVLQENPDVTRPGTRPDELLFNLFMLCTSLSYPAVLGEPLLAVYERRKLGGEWLGTDLRVALTAALISNQIDKRLLPAWQAMLEDKDDDFLIGNVRYGLDGITFMPPSEAAPDEPALDEIGNALKTVARNLSQEHDRRAEFKAFVKTVTDTYPGRPTWAVDLVQIADKNRWPAWAVECLPSLCIRLKGLPDERICYLAWHYILACIPKSYDYEVVLGLCGNHVLRTYVTEETSFFIEAIAPVIEHARLENPFPSDRAMHGVVASAMTDLELLANSLFDSEAAEELREARRKVIDQAMRMPNLNAIGKALKKITSTHESEQDRESMILSLAKPVKALYPDIDLEQVAEGTHSPVWVVESLKQAA
ncbi:MAG TPA: hypothetical protein VEX60_12005 [Pyrinomonadaceae bacterium]|nr:hypothetical protein [Pyrinomonadaceae bacterium]